MPRPTRAQGRPGTKVIPANWGRSHAPVATKSMTAHCRILPPGEGPLVFDPAEKISKRSDVLPTYDGPCRIQILNAQDTVAVVAEQTQSTSGYLITLTRDPTGTNDDDIPFTSDGITLAHTVHVDTCDDPDLVGRMLRIRSVVHGTERFERDLLCVEDQSTPAT